MIADERSQAFVENFTGQWLNVRGMRASEPVVDLFPDFDSTLRASFPARDRAVLRQRHSRGPQHPGFADGRLHLRQRAAREALRHPRRLRIAVPPRDAGTGARHAARPARQGRAADDHVGRGSHVAGQARQVVPRNVLRHQSARSAAGRRNRSDGGRGRSAENAPGARLEAHRTNPSCAGCHQSFEPMGLAMENFDAVGAWRTLDAGQPIDPTGVTNDGTQLDGPREPAGIHRAATARSSRNP